jgi:dipeptidyl aminopeptidase/acylaminoacyl peptidase
VSVYRSLGCLLAVAIVPLASAQIRSDSEIVIAIRYLQAVGTSHAHLYLYREDGKLLRQLTSDDSRQDVDPIFASDGETIVFTREKPNHVREFWSIDPRGSDLKQLVAAPDWNTQNQELAVFHKYRTGRIGFDRCDNFAWGIRLTHPDTSARVQIAGWF